METAEKYDGCSDFNTPAGTHIFSASPVTDETIELAKDFIKENFLTIDDVMLKRTDNYVSIISKKELKLKW